MIILKAMCEEFFPHINSVDEFLEFTEEHMMEQKTIPFLDTLVYVEEDSSLRVRVYRKPTHTDQYLPFDSTHKESRNGGDAVGEALKKCGYPYWALVGVVSGSAKRAREERGESSKERKCQGRMTIPYVKEVSEEIRRILGSVSVTTHFRPLSSLQQSLVHPKDRVPKGKKTNVVYRAVCGVCGDDYVGETRQPLAKRVHQHTRSAAGRPNSVEQHG